MLVAPFYFKSLWFGGGVWLIFRDLNLFFSLYIRDRHPYLCILYIMLAYSQQEILSLSESLKVSA